jgi:hypothetical protein
MGAHHQDAHWPLCGRCALPGTDGVGCTDGVGSFAPFRFGFRDSHGIKWGWVAS